MYFHNITCCAVPATGIKLQMASLCSLLFMFLILFPHLSSSTYQKLTSGSSLSVRNPNHVLVSPSGNSSAGFYRVGDNAYSFAIWFSKPLCFHDCSLVASSTCSENCTVVWMANRNQPVNGKSSRLELFTSGELVLKDADKFTVWSTETSSHSPVELELKDTGNLVLNSSRVGAVLWQSFDHPTDTLLPQQLFTRDMELVSARSRGNFSLGLYKLFFDDDNILRLRYEGHGISSIFWPHPWILGWQSGRSTYNNTRVAVLDPLGNFTSSDNLHFLATDYGTSLQRRLKLDSDGNLRLYSRNENGGSWAVSWQASLHPCAIHGVCGENSMCTYNSRLGRNCSCLPAHKMKNISDRTFGCEPDFKFPKRNSDVGFLRLPRVDFYGFDLGNFQNYTFEQCKELCLRYNCSGFQYTFNYDSGVYVCYPKNLLWNGHRSSFEGDFYLKFPKANLSYQKRSEDYSLSCSNADVVLAREYRTKRDTGALKFILWFAVALGAFQLLFILVAYGLLRDSGQDKNLTAEGYYPAQTGFRRFTYSELKQATDNFSEEIGKGGAGTVYKGRLPDLRVAAIKKLNHANQGEADFLAEVSIIGKLNHMNLIEMWGYCAEKNHRLLVYEYLEHGSLAEALTSNGLEWKRRYKIALGTARGLAYLHEECLEWVLHCDVKPQNILLDSEYHPKVSDFGLSKLIERSQKNMGFSRIRGTRGYMAPEWISNQPITSKVDVYSYGIVALEMLTGKAPTEEIEPIGLGGQIEYKGLVTWVRSKCGSMEATESLLEEIIDPRLNDDYSIGEAQNLLRVGLQCVQEDKDARPTMSQVVEMLLNQNHTKPAIY